MSNVIDINKNKYKLAKIKWNDITAHIYHGKCVRVNNRTGEQIEIATPKGIVTSE
jgi:hypothetical protein